jgi:hypothetical protein
MASAPVRGIRAAPFTSRYSGGWYVDVLVDQLLEADSITTRRSAMGPALVLRRFDGVTAQRLAELAKGHSQVLTAEEVIFVRAHPYAVSIEDGEEVEVRWFRDELAINAFWFAAVRLEDEVRVPSEVYPRTSEGHALH